MTSISTSVEAAPIGTEAYRLFVDHADRLVRPLKTLMQPGQSSLPLEGKASNHGSDADRLEAFARPLLTLALWLRGRRVLGIADQHDRDVIDWITSAMRAGADPNGPEYWGTLTNYHQHAVEFAIFTMALDIGREDIWDPIDASTRTLVLEFLSQIRGHGGHRNNHLFFDVLTLEFLIANGAGELGDDAAIRHHLDELECMHRRDGWFIDGGNESYDHYNAYAFHIYGLWWAHRFGARDEDRAQRWIGLAARFLPSYAHLYAASGEPVPIGRSLTYRFNGVGVFPLAALNGIDTVAAGVGRRIARRCLEFFADHPIEQSQGCLSLGWTDPFDRMTEGYSCAGSPYWAAKGLLMLAMDPSHLFFSEPERPMPSEEEHAPPMRIEAPGWVVRHRLGESEIINAGGSSSMSAMSRMGSWKWGKLVYHTGVDGLVVDGPDGEPGDCQLVARHADDETFIGRHNTVPIVVEDDHIVCQYQIGLPYGSMNVAVRTHLWWRGDWYIALHAGRACQPTVLRGGAFAVPSPSKQGSEAHAAWADGDDWSTRIVAVRGFTAAGTAAIAARQHLRSGKHALPFVESDTVRGRFSVAYAWCLNAAHKQAEGFEVVSIQSGGATVRIGSADYWLQSSDWSY